MWPPPPGQAQTWPPPPSAGGGWGPAPTATLAKAGTARTGPLPLHPMTVSDVLDGAFKLLKANARTVVTIAAIFMVPIQSLAAFLQRDLLGGRGFFDVINDPSTARAAQDSGDNGQALAGLLSFIATVLVLPFVAGAISRVVASSYLGEQLTPGPALRATGRRWWALISSWFLVHLLEFSGLIVAVAVIVVVAATSAGAAGVFVAVVIGLAALPVALMFMTLFVATAPAIVVEELGPVQGMRRSARLMRRRFWGVLGIALLGGFLANILGQILGGVFSFAGLAVGTGRGGWLLIAVGGILSSLITTPLVAIISTLVYFDGRIRHEGFDLQVIAADLARSAPV